MKLFKKHCQHFQPAFHPYPQMHAGKLMEPPYPVLDDLSLDKGALNSHLTDFKTVFVKYIFTEIKHIIILVVVLN